MHGRLADLWRNTMVHGGEMLSAGHPSVLKSFAARQVEHETASPAERQMLQEQVATAEETAQMHGVALQPPPLVYSAEEVAAYENIEKARIASEERLAMEAERLKREHRQRLAIETSRMQIQADQKVAIESKRFEFSEKARVALHQTIADKEVRLSSDATCLEAYKLEKDREETAKAKKALNSANLKIRMQEAKIEHLQKRIDKKDERIEKLEKRIERKDEQLDWLKRPRHHY